MTITTSSGKRRSRLAVENLMRRIDELAPDFDRMIDPKCLEVRASVFGEGKFDR